MWVHLFDNIFCPSFSLWENVLFLKDILRVLLVFCLCTVTTGLCLVIVHMDSHWSTFVSRKTHSATAAKLMFPFFHHLYSNLVLIKSFCLERHMWSRLHQSVAGCSSIYSDLLLLLFAFVFYSIPSGRARIFCFIKKRKDSVSIELNLSSDVISVIYALS